MGLGVRRGAAIVGLAVSVVLVALGLPAGAHGASGDDGPAPPVPSTSATPGPGAASGFFTFGGGAELDGTEPIADFQAGFNVWVLAGTPHVSELGTAIRYVVGQLRRYGIDATFRGVAASPARATGTGRAFAGAASFGKIVVSEAARQDRAPCRMHREGGTHLVTEGYALPRTQDLGSVRRINGASVRLCPVIWQYERSYLTSVALHEMGHAVGLGHYRTEYHGLSQVMDPIVPRASRYRAGDIHGLRYLAARTAQLRADTRLDGQVEAWLVAPGGLRVAGWAVSPHVFQYAVVEVTRDGEVVYSITTNGARPDITARFGALWPDSGFAGSQVPMLPGEHTYCVLAVDPAIQASTRTLGCRRLTFPAQASGPSPVASPSARVSARWQAWVRRAGLGLGAAALLAVGTVAGYRRRTRHDPG